MAGNDLQIKAMDVLFNFYTALKNVQLYDPDNSIITNSVERLYMHLFDFLRQENSLVFAEIDRQIFLRGILLDDKEKNSIHVSSLLDMMKDFGLQSIAFDKGLLREELFTFIKLLAKNPKAVHFSGGLPKLMKENKINHISADKKTYTLNDVNQEESKQKVQSNESVAADILSIEDPISKNIADVIHAVSRLGKMDGSIESFISEEQRDLIKTSLQQITDWIEAQTVVTPDYKKIIESVQKLAQGFINHRLFKEASSIIAVLRKIHTGELQKDDDVRKVSSEVIHQLASEGNIHLLFKDINISEKNKSTDALQILIEFGDDLVVKKLLSTIRNARDSKERIRIIHIIQEMGEKAIPAVQESITPDAPWYFLRNMAYILGRIGNEDSSEILRPFLLHNDKRVRNEALKSISLIGGNKKGAVLISVLTQVDSDLRVNIIELLGKIKSSEAVSPLLDMLKNKSSASKNEQLTLQEKICDALGAIGSAKAISALSEIVDSKSFLGLSSYPSEVKYAAKRALTSIQRKLEGKI